MISEYDIWEEKTMKQAKKIFLWTTAVVVLLFFGGYIEPVVWPETLSPQELKAPQGLRVPPEAPFIEVIGINHKRFMLTCGYPIGDFAGCNLTKY